MRPRLSFLGAVVLGLAALASLPWPSATPTAAQSAQPRLVLFELFASTCPSCVEAGAAMDVVADRYEQAGLPVVFIEYNSHDQVGNRVDRWYDACPDWRSCYLPMELVDSGWRWACGPKDYVSTYTALVDEALDRPALVDLTATYRRSGFDVDVQLHVVNRSGFDLGPANSATANVIVYERARVLNASRFARAAAAVPVDPVLPNAGEATVQIPLRNVLVGDWNRTEVVAVLDYRPEESASRYESLQAAVASEALPPTATLPPSATPSPSPSPTATETPAQTYTPTVTPTWTGEPLYLPLARSPAAGEGALGRRRGP